MNCALEPGVYGKDLRLSCLADFLELEAAIRGRSRSEADLADDIANNEWRRLLEPRYTGGGMEESSQAGELQDESRERAAEVLSVIEQRAELLGQTYPFQLADQRLLRREANGSYLWFLFVSMSHGLGVPDAPDSTVEFEKVVAGALTFAGIPAITVGTVAGSGDFAEKVRSIANEFAGLVPTLDQAIHSVSQNDGGIDTFGMLRCGRDRRHAQWAFVGQSTVGQTESWKTKIHEPLPPFWQRVFGGRIIPIAFFATPHHIPNDYLHKLAADHDRCIFDRIRLASWTPAPPPSFAAYEIAMGALRIE